MVGSLKRFKEPLRQWIEKSQQLTAKNTGLKLIIAVDYSGQWDIIQAVQALARQVKAGTLQSEDITQDLYADCLSLSDLPPPDLLIRTSGEYRISNFSFMAVGLYRAVFYRDVMAGF